MNVRSMISMSIWCSTCGSFIYKWTKFNFRQEDCTRCSAELTIKTDPQNSDYVVESGATDEEERDGDDAMKALEKRTLDSKREMDTLGALDYIMSTSLDIQSTSTAPAAEEEKEESSEDEALVRSIFKKSVMQRISDEVVDNDDREFQFTSSESSLKKSKLSEQSSSIQIEVLRMSVEKISGLKSRCQNNYSDDDEQSSFFHFLDS
ncbi:coiled-coil protein (DUF572) [Citrus sinensis]|uniref:Coiled-coil protein (DUF572) n=1 Tax=Citrus sinensis TaxID=2711 RepID=A0ACB8JEW2_CITSI|nr:coiled-coil protein (DUF572) [Citrus sinensis]